MWRGNCALEELFARRERLAGGVHRCGAVAARRAAWNLRRRGLADAQTCLREAALLVRLHHPAVMRVVAVFRNGDKVMDGSMDVWVLAVPLPPWTAAHLHAPTSLSDIAVDMAVDSGVRTTEQYLATTRHRVGWTPGFEGWRRRAAPRRQTCSRWAGPSLRCGTSASLRCVTSAPGQVLRCAA